MKHGPACVEGLADCDWPSCYLPACATCGRDVPEYPLFFAEAGGAASGPYCDPCAEKRREATHA